MRRGFLVFLVVGWVIGCGGESQGSKASGAGGDGSASAAGSGGGRGGAGGGPVPPPAQGAFWANVKSVSPPPSGKACPAGATLTFDLPAVDPTSTPPETLDANTYVHRLIDGEDAAEVKCSVKGASSYTLEGTLTLGLKSLAISSGTLGADKKGTARVTLRDSGTPGFPGALSAPSANCTVDAAAAGGNNYQVRAGSIWAHFSCASVEQAPSDYCQAEGYFVLENCDQ
jgi:hypothetical protein